MGEMIIFDGIKVPIGSHERKTIVIGADHRGFEYKERIKEVFSKRNYQFIDVGTFSLERCDYPIISNKIAKQVAKDFYNKVGIGICGSGIGILIPASKHRSIYGARCLTPKEAETSRQHNNSNFLSIGADCVNLETAINTIDAWLTTSFYSDPEKEKSYLKRYVQTLKLEERLLK